MNGVAVTSIYSLVDPRTNQVRYVGKSNSPKERFREHLSDISNSRKSRWICELKNEGLLPFLEILEVVDISKWQEREIFWIDRHTKNGIVLLNSTKGGDGFGTHLERTKQALSIVGKGRLCAEETKAKLRAAKIGIAATGRGAKGTPKPQGFGKKVAVFWTGRKHSEETKAKISAARKGKQMSPEVIERIRQTVLKSEKFRAANMARRGKPARGRGAKGMPTTGKAAKGMPKPGVSAYQKGKKKSVEHHKKLCAGYAAFNERLQSALRLGKSLAEARKIAKSN